MLALGEQMSCDYQTGRVELRRKLLVGGIGFTGFGCIFLLLISFGSLTERVENRSFREALAAAKPVSQAEFHPIPKSPLLGIMYTNRPTLCALDEPASAAVVRAIRVHDQKTLNALQASKMLVSLSIGTMFDVDSTRDTVIWGFVRGGPNTGEYCSVIGSFLSTSPPTPSVWSAAYSEQSRRKSK
jgi:hypothetical protein